LLHENNPESAANVPVVIRPTEVQESRAVAGNYRAMRGASTETLHLIIRQRSEHKQH